jgi:hypothetical protein
MSHVKSTKKGSTKGKAEGSKQKARRQSVKERARAIVAGAPGYDEETRHSIKNSLDENDPDLAELVRRAERGETILDVSRPLGGVPVEGQPDAAAVAYAQRAYAAALDHYRTSQGDTFALSRLAVVYEEQEPGDFNMVVTLPGKRRWEGVSADDLREWVKNAELLARTLDHPGCTDAFRTAFAAIYTEHLVSISGVSWTTPAVMRVMFPLVMADLWGNRPADADTARGILITLSSELVSDEASEGVRKSLGRQ